MYSPWAISSIETSSIWSSTRVLETICCPHCHPQMSLKTVSVMTVNSVIAAGVLGGFTGEAN